jgi:hypothetical protein
MGVASLVHFVTAHCVGSRRILFVFRHPASAGCTCVGLIDLVTMSPDIVARERPGCRVSFWWSWCCRQSHWSCQSCRSCVAFGTRKRLCKFLVGHRKRGDQCCECQIGPRYTVVLFEAASARFSRALPMRSMVGAAAGITAWAPPRGSPPPKA